MKKHITGVVALAFAKTCVAALILPTDEEIDALFPTNASLLEISHAVYPVCTNLFRIADRIAPEELLRMESRLMTNVVKCVFATNRSEDVERMYDQIVILTGVVGGFRLLENEPEALYYWADHVGDFQPVSTNAMYNDFKTAYEADTPERNHRNSTGATQMLSFTTNIWAQKVKWSKIKDLNHSKRMLRRRFLITLSDSARVCERKFDDEAEKAQFRSNIIERAKLDEREAQLLFRE